MSESAYKSFEISSNGYLKGLGNSHGDLDEFNSSRQSYPKTYVANGYADVLSVEFILSSLRLHGSCVLPFITPVIDEIDTEDDFLRIQLKVDADPRHFFSVFETL